MALSLYKFKPLEAPDRYYFRDPDTARDFEHADKKGLILQIVQYRSQNELEPLEYLGVVIDAYMCSLPRYRYKCELSEPFERSVYGYIKGGLTLLKNMFYGSKNMVDPVEADMRAEQCTNCKFNIFPDKKEFLRWSDGIAEASTHGRRSKHYDKLGNCMVCSCPLRAKVWYKCKGESFPENERKLFKEVNCWQISE